MHVQTRNRLHRAIREMRAAVAHAAVHEDDAFADRAETLLIAMRELVTDEDKTHR